MVNSVGHSCFVVVCFGLVWLWVFIDVVGMFGLILLIVDCCYCCLCSDFVLLLKMVVSVNSVVVCDSLCLLCVLLCSLCGLANLFFGVALRFLCCSVMLLCCFVGYGWCGRFCLDRETVGCGWFLLGW